MCVGVVAPVYIYFVLWGGASVYTGACVCTDVTVYTDAAVQAPTAPPFFTNSEAAVQAPEAAALGRRGRAGPRRAAVFHTFRGLF